MIDKRLLNICVGAALCAALSLSIQAQESNPWSLKEGSWVCASPEAYEMVSAAQSSGKSPFALQKTHRESCLYMDDDNLEDMLAPFVMLHGEEGDKTKVAFFVEFYKKVEFLHRQIKHVKFVGWTATENVKRMYD